MKILIHESVLREETPLISAQVAAEGTHGHITDWNTTGVTDMSELFLFASDFDEALWRWDTSSVTDMRAMFYGATTFNHHIGSWDVSSVVSMEDMFRDASTFDQDLSRWDVSSVTDMDRMFEATAMTFDLCWDVTNVPPSQVVAPIYDQDMPPCSTTVVEVAVGRCVEPMAGEEFVSIAGEPGVVEAFPFKYAYDYRDGTTTEVDLPFPFPFFGTTYTTVWVGPNGTLKSFVVRTRSQATCSSRMG